MIALQVKGTYPPLRASSLRRRHSYHSHVPQTSASCQLPGILRQGLKALAEKMEDRHQRFEEHGYAHHSQALQSSSSSTARGALDKRLTWPSHIDKDRKKAAQSLGVLDSLLNRSGLSVRNGVLLYMQLIRPTMDCACRIWRSAAWEPRQEASDASIQVSSRCYWCTGIATLFKCVLSADVKSVSEKCWLHTYCVRSFLVCSALQVFPSLCSQQCPVQQ